MSDALIEFENKDHKDQIVITVHETPEKSLILRSVDLFIPSLKVRLSSQATDDMEQIFHRDIAALVQRICGSATLPKQIINVPDFCLRFRGLAIRGYTLLVHTLEDGMRQFIIRLKRGVGNALALFQDSALAEGPFNLVGAGDGSTASSRSSAQLFEEMLSNLYLPLVNLNTYLRATFDDPAKAKDSALAGSLVQLKSKTELLQFAFDRLISERMIETYAHDDEREPRKPALPFADPEEIRRHTA